MDKYSARIKIKSDHVRKDGASLLYLQVIINSKVEKINLKLYWPQQKFTEEKLCVKRDKLDAQANDYNMILRGAVAKANDIFTYYRLGQLSLNMETFKKEYYNHLSKTDFVKFMEQKIDERWRKRDISDNTHKNHISTLRKLQEFKSELPFNQFNTKFPDEFERFLKQKHKNSKSTIWGRQKDIKTYLHIAANDENIKFEDPYRRYQVAAPAGKWKALSVADVNRLFAYYQEQAAGSRDRRILQRFLFGCCTGLRLSDQKRVKIDWIVNGVLHFMPFKTRKYEKILELPLTSKAMELVQDAMRENAHQETIFYSYTDQFTNRRLQTIGEQLEIKTKLHNHVGRETFATLYLEWGGNVEVLQKYLDHSKISTTMRYVHVSQKRKKEEMHRMEKMFEPTPVTKKEETPV